MNRLNDESEHTILQVINLRPLRLGVNFKKISAQL
jgi:hypothetical protein